MSYPQPNNPVAELLARQAMSISERVSDLNEEVAFNDFELKDAFEQIEKIIVASNTNEKLAKANAAAHDSNIKPPDIDTSGFDIKNGPKIQKYYNIVSSRMSYTYDVVDWFNKSISQTEMLRQLMLQQMPGNPQGQVQVIVKQKGWWTRMLESLGIIEDDEVVAKQETVDYITGKFKQIQLAEDQWATLLNTYEEFIDNEIDFGKVAAEIRMFQRNLHQVERIILGVLDKGFRLHMQETARDLNALVQSMSQTSNSLMAAQQPQLPAPGNGR